MTSGLKLFIQIGVNMLIINCIFGSFLLKCIYQVDWDDYDVDILGNLTVTYDAFDKDTDFINMIKTIYDNNYTIKTESFKDQAGKFGVRKFKHINYRY